jgi:hypothetical protein
MVQLGLHFMTVRRRMIEYGIRRRNMGTRPAHGDQLQRPAEVLTRRFLQATYQPKAMTTIQISAKTGFNPSTVKVLPAPGGHPDPPVRVRQAAVNHS